MLSTCLTRVTTLEDNSYLQFLIPLPARSRLIFFQIKLFFNYNLKYDILYKIINNM